MADKKSATERRSLAGARAWAERKAKRNHGRPRREWDGEKMAWVPGGE